MREKPEPSSTFMSIFLIKPCQTGGAGQPGTAMGMGGRGRAALPSPAASPVLLGFVPMVTGIWQPVGFLSAKEQAWRCERRLPKPCGGEGCCLGTSASRHVPLWTSSTQLHLLMLLPVRWHRHCRSSSPMGAVAPRCPQHPSVPARSPTPHPRALSPWGTRAWTTSVSTSSLAGH